MSSIDSRVVEATFDNRQFQEGVRGTLDSLSKLKDGLRLDGATRGLDDIDRSAKSVDLSNIAAGVDTIASRFNALTAVATAAITRITFQLVDAGEQWIKSFTIAPITDGLHEYETQLNSIQTILSNTQWEHKNLEDVNGALNKLNHYSDKTIYNFTQMARNIGTFTAAGVKLDTSVAAIKGIANLAAVSGSNADQASTAMYQLSQALSTGTVRLMDWNSVVNAGMGGKVFQDALKETARVHGVAIDSIIKKEGSFRDSLQTGWLSADILTETLKKFTGDLTAKQLKQMGYTDQQIKGILKMGKTATDAATKVKTFHQLIDTVKESIGSGWAKTWQQVFGDFHEARSMWTNLNNFIGGFVQSSSNARKHVLDDWRELGGRTVMIDAVKKAFDSLMSVLKPIHDAFREIFPRKTGQDLYNMTVAIRDFFEHFKIGADAAENLKRTLAGFFAVLDIGWQVIKQAAHFIGDLFGALTKGEGSGGFLGVTGSIGDFLVALDNAIKKGNGLRKFFEGLENILAGPIKLIHILTHALFNLFDFHLQTGTSGLKKSFKPINDFGHTLLDIWTRVTHVIGAVWHFFKPLGEKIAELFAGLSEDISRAFGGINYEDMLHTINTGLFAGLVLLFKQLVDHFTGGLGASGFLEALMSPFKQLTATMKTMQTTLRATTLLQIAAAVGILTGSLVALSRIDAAGLTRGLTAISVMFGQLFASVIIFEKIGGFKGLPAIAFGLILFGTALRVLTSSVKALSELSWNDLAKGLTGVTVLIGGLILAVRGMNGETAGMVRAGAGLLVLAVGIKVLASALTDISSLSWEEIGKGLTGVGSILVGLALFTKFVSAGKAGVLQSAGLLLLATAIKVLANAVETFANLSWQGIAKGLGSIGAILAAFVIFSKTIGKPITVMMTSAALVAIAIAIRILAKALEQFAGMSWSEIGKGLGTLAASLLILVGAMKIMQSSVLGGATMVLVAGSLLVLTKVLKSMAGMSWGEIAKGLIVLAGSLLIMTVALNAMSGSVLGAAAMVIAAGALGVLVGVLKMAATMSWGEIVKSLVVLAATLIVVSVASVALSESIPFILGFAAGIALLGLGVAGIGLGISLLATGLSAFTLSIIASISAIAGSLPVLVRQVGLIITALAETIQHAGPAMATAMGAVLVAISEAIIKAAPKVYKAIRVLVENFLKSARKLVPDMVETGLDLIEQFMRAIIRHEDDLIDLGSTIVVKFLNGLARNMGDIVDAGTNLIVSFLEGIAENIPKIQKAAVDIIIAWVKGIGKQAVRIANAALDVVVDFINGLADAIESHSDDFRKAGMHMAWAIADGMTFGLAGKAKDVVGGAVDLGKKALGGLGSAIGLGGPSKEFCKIGKYAAQGFANGLVGGKDDVKAAWQTMHDTLKQAMDDTKQDIDTFKSKIKDLSEHEKKNAEEIAKYKKKLAEATAQHQLAKGALDDLNSKYDDEYDKLKRLGERYDKNHEKLQQANQDYKDAIRTRNDYRKQTTQMLEQTPDITKETHLGDFLKEEKYQLNDILKFTTTLQKLRKKGLDDRAYKMLLDKGVEALPLAEEILAGGKKSIDEVNDLGSELHKAAKALGTTGSEELYQAGVDAAQGVVDGLKDKRKDIAKEMSKIADDIVDAIKKKLKIKSPSRVMHGLGIFTARGLALGLKKAAPLVKNAAGDIGDNAVETMRKAISGVSKILEFETDMNPKITPVLDLTHIRKNAPEIGNLLSATPIAVDSAYLRAKVLANGYSENQAAQRDQQTPVVQSVGPDITFIQNNNSPRALSTADIYRQTNNQLSKVKGALTEDAA